MNFMDIYQHQNPGRMIFGLGAIEEICEVLPNGAKPLIVTDQGVKGAGLWGKLSKILSAAGIEFALYDKVQPDAPIYLVEEAIGLYREKGCDCLLALGGGSPMDTAKAVGILATNSGTVKEYVAGKIIENPLPTLVAIPTTAGTGSEVTGVAVVADKQARKKMVLRGGPAIMASTAILDPNLLAGLPPRVAAETGADALSHAMEALVGRGNQPFADAQASQAIRLISKYLRPMVGDPSNLEAAGNMLIASTLAGMSFANAGLGLTHSLAHPLGAYYHVSHGRACGLYLPIVLEFNAIACAERYRLAAEAMGLDVQGLSDMESAQLAVEGVRELFGDIGIALSYSELGVDFELKDEMVDEVMSVLTRTNNPRVSDRQQIMELFTTP